MNEQQYDHRDIIKYLLGRLPASEAERFDELGFTDAEFADALGAIENDLIDGYVRGELDAATRERFEAHYLASPLRREKVKIAEAFQVYAERQIAKSPKILRLKSRKPKRTIAGFFSALNVFANRNPILQWGFVAAAAFVILGGLWIFTNRSEKSNDQMAKRQNSAVETNRELPPTIAENRSGNANAESEVAQANVENETNQRTEREPNDRTKTAAPRRESPREPRAATPKINVASFLLLPSLRGDNRIPSVSISEKATDAAVGLKLESDDYAAYRVILTNLSNNKIVWRSGDVKSPKKSANKTLNVRFPAKLLNPQTYSLQVSGVNADGAIEIISDYPFRIVR